MIKNNYTCYNSKTNVFEIVFNNNNIVSTINGNYGVEINLDINTQLVPITIPEPDILFGCDAKILEKIICNNFT